MTTFESRYAEREWHRYLEAVSDGPRLDRSGLLAMNSSSELYARMVAEVAAISDDARATAEVRSCLVIDFELLAADSLDLATLGGDSGRLTEPWHGHPAGSLVLTFYVRREGGGPFDIDLAVLVAPGDLGPVPASS